MLKTFTEKKLRGRSEMMDQSEEVFSKLAAYVTLQPECFGIA